MAFEDYLPANCGANLKAFLPLAFDIKDQSAEGNHGFSYSGVTFGGPTPLGFKYGFCAKFDGAAAHEDGRAPIEVGHGAGIDFRRRGRLLPGFAISEFGSAPRSP